MKNKIQNLINAVAFARAGLTTETALRRAVVDGAILKVCGVGRKRAQEIGELLAQPPVVVTRHPALVELLRERGIIGDDVRIIAHATADDVLCRHVIGVLPLSLAALAWRVTEIPLALTPDMRGRELTLEELRVVAGDARTYTVRQV